MLLQLLPLPGSKAAAFSGAGLESWGSLRGRLEPSRPGVRANAWALPPLCLIVAETDSITALQACLAA